MQTRIQPVDTFVREGFAKTIKDQFRAPAIFTSSPDETRNLQYLQKNGPVQYPYIFLRVQTMGQNTEGYMSSKLARQGIPVTLSTDNNQYELARIIPTNFEIEVTFVTNKYSGELDSVEGFARRWILNRRNGASLFTVNYGLTNLPISYAVSDQLTIPARENPTDQESVYKVVGNVTLHGYISEPTLGTRGRINQIVLSDSVPTLGLPGEKFMPF